MLIKVVIIIEEFLTKKQLSKLLNVHENTIDRWRKQGLPSIKVERKVLFDKNKVMKWLEKKEQ